MTTDQVNYLNIGLMLASLALAFILPFELFLFSYAILGPLHYLTEISWLHDRQYFSPKKWDWIPLLIVSVLILLSTGYILKDVLQDIGFWDFLYEWKDDLTFGAFGLALVFVLLKSTGARILGLAILVIAVMLFHYPGTPASPQDTLAKYTSAYTKIFVVYLPTLIHVYIFTGAFIIFGALKRNSRTGYISFAVFLFCAVACFLFLQDPSWYQASEAAITNFSDVPFSALNAHLLDDLGGMDLPNASVLVPQGLSIPDNAAADSLSAIKAAWLSGIRSGENIYTHPTSIMIMRFVAFAYTYHYLNWFSKTSVIRWHKVPRARFIVVLAVWVGSVALYLYDYKVGFQWLFLLSFMHVLLEFPLNHQSFIGIGQELKARLMPAPAAAKK